MHQQQQYSPGFYMRLLGVEVFQFMCKKSPCEAFAAAQSNNKSSVQINKALPLYRVMLPSETLFAAHVCISSTSSSSVFLPLLLLYNDVEQQNDWNVNVHLERTRRQQQYGQDYQHILYVLLLKVLLVLLLLLSNPCH